MSQRSCFKHAYTCTYMHTCRITYIQRYMRLCMSVSMYVCQYVRLYALFLASARATPLAHVHNNASVHICVYISLYVFMITQV